MSLVNDMLRDLDRRKGHQPGPADVAGYGALAQGAQRSQRLLWLLGGVVVLLLVALAALGWYWLMQQPERSQADSVATSAVAPPNSVVRSEQTTNPNTAVPEPTSTQASAIAPPPEPLNQQPATSEQAAADLSVNGSSASDEAASAEAKGFEPVAAASVALPVTAQADGTLTLQKSGPAKVLPVAEPAAAAEPGPFPDVGDTPSMVPPNLARTDAEPPPTENRIVKREQPSDPKEQAERAVNRAMDLWEARNQEDALRVLRGFVSQHPEQPQSALALATFHLQRGEFDAARTALTGLDIRNSEARKLRARILVAEGDVEGAILGLEAQPPSVAIDQEYHALLAALYQQVERHNEAALSYSQLVQVDRNRADWWAGLGISLEAEKQVGAARQAYQQALRLGNLHARLRPFVQNRLRALN